ncbi:retrovirus-related pol polyprotein from transposon TNT 1-94 [Tanacetum coccineum]|uniref:Retrovirus-related pol polyprotein from transposon TNT 1-94 n=1 Tax=Tanacetum coccineum TaxID=301880 RepID=A0ABQ5E132_9ASTR
MDVKSPFLNGKLKEEVYVKQPSGFESSEFPDYVCKLDKAFYGLKQTPKACMMGELTYFLGLQIKENDKGISICQEQYTRILLKKCEISDSFSVKTPMVPPKNLVLCVRYQSNLKESHLIGVKRILRGKLVCWSAKKQQSVAMSSAEAEYVVVARCCASILWMKRQLSDYDIYYKMVPIFYDNTSANSISNNPVLQSRTKHIDISPSVLYQNLPREFWSTLIAYEPNPLADDSVASPLEEYLIKFLVMNEKSFTLDFNTFCSCTGLDYNKGKYVVHPSPEAVNELGKIATNASYLDKTHVLDRNYSSTEQINSIQQMITYCLITRTEADIGEIIYSDLKDSVSPLPLSGKKKKRKSQTVTSTLPQSQGPEASGTLPQKRKKPKSKKPPTKTNGTRKSQPFPEGTTTDPKDSVGNKQPINMGLPSTVSDKVPGGTRLRYQTLTENKGKTSSKVESDLETLPLTTLTDIQAYLLYEDELAQESDEEEVFAVTSENFRIFR